MLLRDYLRLRAPANTQFNRRAAGSNSDEGAYLVQTFPRGAYGSSPQNWAAVQDLRGVMYFANTDGLLEYDGCRGGSIKVKDGSPGRSPGSGATPAALTNAVHRNMSSARNGTASRMTLELSAADD